jgi:activator of HSP90 ATPase
MKESVELKETFNVKPSVIYAAWLDSGGHEKMTGGVAQCSTGIGAGFSTWDGYITGKNIELTNNKRIVQSWRTSEFEENDEDSKLLIELRATDEGTELTIIHTNIPQGQTQYKKGWLDHYFTPMKEYFG